MEHRSYLIRDRRAELYLPDDACSRILYLHGGLEDTAACADLIVDTHTALVLLPDVHWNDELSPWPAPGVFRDSGDFGGRAPEYLRLLTETMIPFVEAQLPCAPEHRGIAGYSLGGLFAVYALLESPLFDFGASMSGSLWFDGFLEYARGKMPEAKIEKLTFSIGDREKRTRNQRMAIGEDCTRTFAQELERYGTKTEFTLHPGGHFNDVAWRIREGVRSVLE